MFFCSTVAFLLVRVLKVVKPVNMPRRDYLRRVMPIGVPTTCRRTPSPAAIGPARPPLLCCCARRT